MHNSTVVKCKKGQNGSNPAKEKGGGKCICFERQFYIKSHKQLKDSLFLQVLGWSTLIRHKSSSVCVRGTLCAQRPQKLMDCTQSHFSLNSSKFFFFFF